MPCFALISKVMIPKIQNHWQNYIIKSEKVKDLTDEIFNGSLTIKLANAYSYINDKIERIINEYAKNYMKYLKKNIIYDHLLVSGFLSVSNTAITILGALLVINGSITVGIIIMLTTYFAGLWNSLEYFMYFLRNYNIKMVSLKRIFNFMSLPIERNDGVEINDFQTLKLENISYLIDGQMILKDLSLEVKRGDKVLISGDNGSGKSTLVRLIICLMSPSNGKILYNNEEISKFSVRSIREKINYIPSEPFIFSGCLHDNFFVNNVNSDIIDLEKYSRITKDGGNLSSGEKKKLQLARGMTTQSEIYILDEPLNFVDEISKRELVETIKKEFCEKTLIVISHESAPFEFCEIKYLMNEGRLEKIHK